MELLSREHNDSDSRERVGALARFSPVRLRQRFNFAGTHTDRFHLFVRSHAFIALSRRAVFRRWNSFHRRGSVALQETGEVGGVHLTRAYLSAIALGFTNPLTAILFLAALHAFSTQGAAPPLVAGVFVGSAIWWTVLSTMVATARSRLTPRMLSLSSRFASLILLGLGTTMLVRIAQRML